MDESTLLWAILAAIAVVSGSLAILFIRAHQLRRRHDAHLARHGIDGHAQVIDAYRGNFRVNSRPGWIVVVVWRDPHTGAEHRLESGLVFEEIGLGDSPRARFLAAGELPVRIDPKSPEQFHNVAAAVAARDGTGRCRRTCRNPAGSPTGSPGAVTELAANDLLPLDARRRH